MMSITASITKHAFQPRSADEIGEAMMAAFEIARSGRPGPVYVDLPRDALIATTRAELAAPPPSFSTPAARANRDAFSAASRLLAGARRPVLLLGGGAVLAGAGAEVRRLAETLALPVVTTITAKGLFPESHPQALGMIGMYGRKSAVWALQEADVVLALGCRFTDRITGVADEFSRGKKIIHVDIDAYELGKNVPAAIAIQADAREAAAALCPPPTSAEPSEERRSWLRQTGGAREICAQCVPHRAERGLHPKNVMDALNRVLRRRDIVTTGVGQHQMFACHFLEFDEPGCLLTSAGAGTMGYGLPAAIGAARARPDARVFVVDGDGSFQMTCQELATVAQEDLPIVMLVLDNGQLGMVRQWQDREYEGRWESVCFGDRPGHPDFAALARSFGVRGKAIRDREELSEALDDCLQARGPTLLHVAIDPSVDNAPMMPAGQTFADFGGHCVSRRGEFFDATERKRMDAGAEGGE